MKDSKFSYESDMKNYYKSDEIAEQYFKKYKAKGDWREQIIAYRESKVVTALLRGLNCDKVLDIPTGTGKLAPIFAKKNSSVLACDISKNMLQIAEREYKAAGHNNVHFRVTDAEDLSGIRKKFDVAVCLRLLHRVPKEIKKDILNELSLTAEYIIVSTGIETTYHRYRRNIRKILLGDDNRGNCYENPVVTNTIFSDGFEIIQSKWVLPFLSQEKIFLLKPSQK